MIELTEKQLKEYNDAITKILTILKSSTTNPILMLSLIDTVRMAVAHGELVKLPEIHKKLGIKSSSKGIL